MPTDLHCQRLRPQPFAAANRARRGGHEAQHIVAVAVAARLVDGIAQVTQNSMKSRARRLALGRAVDQDVLLTRRQILERHLQIDLVPVGSQMDQFEQVLRRRSRPQAAVEQRL